MARDQYLRQVDLLVRTLPYIARHEAFAQSSTTRQCAPCCHSTMANQISKQSACPRRPSCPPSAGRFSTSKSGVDPNRQDNGYEDAAANFWRLSNC